MRLDTKRNSPTATGLGTVENGAPPAPPPRDGIRRVGDAEIPTALELINGEPRPTRRRGPTTPAPGQFHAAREAKQILRAFDKENVWTPFLQKYTTKSDVENVHRLAKLINPEQADELLVRFFRSVVGTRESQPATVAQMFEKLPKDWYKDPLYYTYVQYFGTPSADSTATFDDLIKQLDHLEHLGIKNIFLLPHYSSPGGDGGYDVSDFKPRAELGGQEAYERFMAQAIERGFRVITDIPANHTSTQHKWFQALLRGDKEAFDYYINVDGVRKLVPGTVEVDGRPRNLIKTKDDMISMPWVIFPHASDKNWIDVQIQNPEKDGPGSSEHQFFHSFYPFQVDLNLGNAKVLEELFNLIGSEANVGNVGKRMDAAPHWFKKPGTDFESIKETHALQEIFKSYIRHVVAKRGISLPEVGSPVDQAVSYFGAPMEIGNEKTTSEGDGLFAFEMQAALRETIYTGSQSAFWRTFQTLPQLPEEAVWLNMIGHHDEMRTDLISEGSRGQVRAMLMQKGALDFAGRGLGGRTANFLDKDPQRIANAFFALFMAPGTPVIYYGDEIGCEHQPKFMEAEQQKRHRILNELGVKTELDQALDTRDLNRGPVPASDFAAARAARYPAMETIRALNALRSERPSLKSRNLAPLPSDRDDVLAMVRTDPQDRPIVALSNLTGEVKTLRVARATLEAQLGPLDKADSLLDLLGTQVDGAERRIPIRHEGDAVLIELQPYAHALFG